MSVPRMSDQRPLVRICFSVAGLGADTSRIASSLSLKRHVRLRPFGRAIFPVPPLIAAETSAGSPPSRQPHCWPHLLRRQRRAGPDLPTRTARRSLLQSLAGGRRVCPLSVMKTYTAKPGEIQREWYLVDAEGKTLGRLATQIADRL